MSLLLVVDCSVVGGGVCGIIRIIVKAGVWGQTLEKHQENSFIYIRDKHLFPKVGVNEIKKKKHKFRDY